LATRRHHGTRTVVPDELTFGLATDWIRGRHAALGTNRHLFVSQQSAVDLHQTMSRSGIDGMFAPLGISARQPRIDRRILDEARHTTDPVHLMRIFSITAGSAIKYVRTARPERFKIDPTAP
jgi:hypothetical protein